jgi:predicted MPP superfamily phosphohydrolase
LWHILPKTADGFARNVAQWELFHCPKFFLNKSGGNMKSMVNPKISPNSCGLRSVLWQRRLDREARDPKMDPLKGESVQTKVLRAGFKSLGLYERGVLNLLSPVLNRLEFSAANLPAAFDGFRILHLSDFHFPGPPGFFEALCSFLSVPECRYCDLCVLTGDYAFNRRANASAVTAMVTQLLSLLSPRHGVIAIPGINDTSIVLEMLKHKGLPMLLNEHTELEQGGERIYIAGVDDPHEFRCASVLDAVCRIPAGAFTLLLAHSPEVAAAGARAGASVYLCGHTHGGQICLPGGRPLFINARCPRSRAAGPWRVGDMQAYTTRGLGASTIEVRFACPPDAAIITLRCRD